MKTRGERQLEAAKRDHLNPQKEQQQKREQERQNIIQALYVNEDKKEWIEEEKERIDTVSKASRLISTINADPNIVIAGDLSKEDWKNYRYVMEKVGHSVTNKQVGRDKMLENLEKYKDVLIEKEDDLPMKK